jgi:carbamoyltransferase
MSTYYVGLSVTGHDPAFAIVGPDGQLLFAEATERYLQDKRAWGAAADHLPHIASAITTHCPDMDALEIGVSWTGTKRHGVPSGGFSGLLPAHELEWLARHQERAVSFAGANLKLLFPDLPVGMRHFDHHLAHASYAVASAPFDGGRCLVLDGEGEVGSATLFDFQDRRLARKWRSWGPGSLGVYYALLTTLCGFDWKAGEEWKVMGLAAFGEVRPDLTGPLEQLIAIEGGRPRLGAKDALNAAMTALAPSRRNPGADIMLAADTAASGQAVFANLATAILSDIGLSAGERLVLTGGCALNSSFNGTIRKRFGLDAVHVPSAPADDGNAIGAALLAWQAANGDAPLRATGADPFLGNTPDFGAFAASVRKGGFGRLSELRPGETQPVARLLAEGQIVGVMRGRAEFGPRALGNRSILADPRPDGMKDRLNREVKGREAYRPFAPVVRTSDAGDWFEDPQPSPYMSFTKRFQAGRARRVPAVVHADGTGRLQTVDDATRPWLNGLIGDLERETGVPMLLNTSLNVMGKPIAHLATDALTILATTGLDALLVDEVLIEKRPALP